MPGIIPDELIQILTPFFKKSNSGVYLAKPGVILTASATEVVFDRISPNYVDLMITGLARTDRVSEDDAVAMQFNGDTGNNYDRAASTITSAGISTVVGRAGNKIVPCRSEAANSTAGAFSNISILIPSYSNTDTWKTCGNNAISFSRGNASADADLGLVMGAGTWNSTAAIHTIRLYPNTGPNFVSGTRFYLWGVM